MNISGALRKKRTWLIGVPILVFLGAVVAPFVYIHFIQDEAPPPLTFEDLETTTTEAGDASADPPSTSEVVSGTTSVTTSTETGSGVDGTYTVATGEAGYRITEVLFGQDTTAAGRTDQVIGEFVIEGATLTSAQLTVDMASVATDQSRRDGQFRDRIMEVDTYPTSTFTLRDPVDLGDLPADLTETTYSVTGDFTIHGVTKSMTFDLVARRNGDNIEITGSIPFTFDDFSISDPSGGPASVHDDGLIEFALSFAR